MKVLLANNHFGNWGGADIFTYQTGKLLQKNRHDVFFFASDRAPFFEKDYEYSKYFPKYVEYKSLSKLDLAKNIFRPLYNYDSESKIKSYISEVKPEVAHFNCINYHLTPSVINACHKMDIPVVMTLHDSRFLCPAGTMMRNAEIYCSEELCISGSNLNCISNRCKYKKLMPSLLVTAECYLESVYNLKNKVSKFICPSQALFDLALRSGISKNKLVVLNNFVEDSYFNIQPKFENKGYFLFVGRLAKEKGVDYLVKAMAKNPEIELRIVGTGNQEQFLINLVSSLHLKNVKFLGFKSGKELAEEYKNCLATVIPSYYFENFPTTIIESFVYGKPVIGSNLGGIPEMIDHGENGLLFEPGDVNDLSQKIKIMYENKEQASVMGKNGRAKAEANYTSQVYYSKLMKIYENVGN